MKHSRNQEKRWETVGSVRELTQKLRQLSSIGQRIWHRQGEQQLIKEEPLRYLIILPNDLALGAISTSLCSTRKTSFWSEYHDIWDWGAAASTIDMEEWPKDLASVNLIECNHELSFRISRHFTISGWATWFRQLLGSRRPADGDKSWRLRSYDCLSILYGKIWQFNDICLLIHDWGVLLVLASNSCSQ